MKEVAKCHIERRERRSFHPPHAALKARAITRVLGLYGMPEL